MPRRFISRVEVSTSAYLGAVDLELNPQFNALIGGRGTGKSTFLEYVRWAMQDQVIEFDSDDAVDRKRQYFVETLREVDGVVRVHWSFDGTPHVVTFDPKRLVVTLKVGQDAERSVTGEEVRNLLPIRAYSQKQLSSVSGKRGELQRFVEEPICSRLQQFENEFESLRSQVRTHYANRRRRLELGGQLHLQQTRLASTQERIRTLQESLTNLSPEAERAMREHSARLIEQGYIETLAEQVDGLLGSLENVASDDLDSEIIAEVIRDIMAAKDKRQIIFASHNANLVVNGDAELVVKFATKTHDGQTHGEIEHQGAIDCKPVREAITAVMEGGRKAFDLRRQKYGF